MDSNAASASSSEHGRAPLPPAVTAGQPAQAASQMTTSILPPFVPGEPTPSFARTPAAPATASVAVQQDFARADGIAPVELNPNRDAPAMDAQPVGSFEAAPAAPLEPVEDITSQLQQNESVDDQEFPLDAFIIPDGADRVLNGMQDRADEPEGDPSIPSTPAMEARAADVRAVALAEGLERLARRLRADGAAGLTALSRDKTERALAAFLAGYLAASEE